MAETSRLSAPPEANVLPAAFVAIALFAGAWWLLHVGFYSHKQILDTPVYQRYGNAIAGGEVPYRDFSVEYPPGALPVFALPGLARAGHEQHVTTGFRHAFEALMWLCGAAAIASIAVALSALRASPLRVWGVLGFAAVAPLALGSVLLSRYDLWPTALLAAALAAVVSGWFRLGGGLLGLAIAAKLYPVVLVPLVLAHAWKHAGRRAALACASVIIAVVAVVFVPFVVLSPTGVWHSLTGQLTRPLQIESLGSALLVAAHHVAGVGVTQQTSHGSQNLVGQLPRTVAGVQTVLQVTAVAAVWALYARTRATREGLLRASAAALVVFVALGKVLSPQFLIWLIPVVPLVRGRRGVWACGGLLAALLLTQLWFPYRYWRYADDFAAVPSWLVLARDLLLVVLAVGLVLPGADERNDEGEPVAGRRSVRRVCR